MRIGVVNAKYRSGFGVGAKKAVFGRRNEGKSGKGSGSLRHTGQPRMVTRCKNMPGFSVGLGEITGHVESTFNGYWLVAGLQEAGILVKLVNTAKEALRALH